MGWSKGSREMNAVQIMVGLFSAPHKAMDTVVAHPRTWLVAAAIMIASLVAATAVTGDAALELANERSQETIDRITANMDDAQAQLVRERSQPMTAQRFWLTAVGVGTLMMALGWVARGTVVHFSGMALGGISSWGTVFAAVVWADVIYAVRNVLQAVFFAVTGQLVEHQGLSGLVAQADWMANARSIPYAVLSRVDPFSIWFLIVMTAAAAVACKLSTGKAAVLVIVVWAVFVGLGILPVLLGRAIMPA